MNLRQTFAIILLSVLLFAAHGEYFSRRSATCSAEMCIQSNWFTFPHHLCLGHNLRGFDEEEDSQEHRLLKWNAAQKRQEQRDNRRRYTNPYRTQDEERSERWRKHTQGQNRGNSRVDPYEPAHGGHAYSHHRQNGKQWKKNDFSNPHWYP